MLALASCGSGGIVSFAACQRAARVAAHDTARHDCCHAHPGKHATNHATASNDATHDDAARADAARDAHAACVEPTGDDGATRAGCCAVLPARTSTPAVAATNDASRTRLSHVASTRQPSPGDAPLLRLALAPTQHAPPPHATRLHILISVLLI
jgi:hypothetical protein